MKNVFGNSVSVTLYGESHGAAIGAVIDGIAPGIAVDEEFIASLLLLRRPSDALSTSRREADPFTIESGVFNGFTTGTPISIRIPNGDTRSKDYGELQYKMRPGHADYTAQKKYNGFSDYRGGGHFSGRITAALVAAAGIIIPALNKKGIYIGTHISRCACVDDAPFTDYENDIKALNAKQFAVLDDKKGEQMKENILKAKSNGDSVGGVLETAVCGIPAGVGEPWFDTVEGLLSHALFSIPAIKGVEFGDGFSLCDMTGSCANDAFYYDENGAVKTRTNHNGGINGGITNGMPVIFRCAVKPTPTVSVEQETVNINTKENTTLSAAGRHDPCIVHRARVVIDSITAITICDMLTTKFGTDWLAK